MGFRRLLGGFGLALLVSGCGGKTESASSTDADVAVTPTAPVPPLRAPELPVTGERDADGDRLDDVLDERAAEAAIDDNKSKQLVAVQAVLSAPVEQSELDDFVAAGGNVRYVFRELSYGFTGALPAGKLREIAARFGDKLHLLAAPSEVVPFMDEATRTGRIRGIWAANFAGNASGYSGNANITVAILDTGVDSSHTDLNGRMQGFQDYTSDAAATARDVGGHGTHVASIAVGTGAAFGASTASLKYTQSGSLSGVTSGAFGASTIHTPAYLGSSTALNASATATFLGGVPTTLHTLTAPDNPSAYTTFGNVTGSSPLTLTNKNGGTGGMIYQGALLQANPASLTNFAIANTIANYPSVGDGFNALRGVAPSCKWFGAKVFTDGGSGNSFDIEEALDDVVARKSADNIKIANLSLGVTGSGTDSVMRAKVNTTVEAGIVVVVAAGNDGPSTTMGDPGRASKVITVGATNDVNELTKYTSIGPASPGSDEDTKPDVVAPGGSFLRSGILAADTNTADGNSSSFADLVANDYSSLQGTSMATPFVSGSLALMIDALQQSGTSFTFGSSAQPLFLKMLLSASATELNTAREQGTNSPTLGRASTLKDSYEGYGIINPDAAIEAMVQAFSSPLTGSVSNVSPARLEWEKRAWGRKLALVNGSTVSLSLSVPSTGDYDLYLFAGSADAKGNPTLRASATTAGSDTDESLSFTSFATETAYLFVKRVSGYGAFSLTGSATSHCGDGDLDSGEACDPAMAGSTTCCSSTCTIVTNGTSCNDGNACTTVDKCQAGVCTGSSPVTCTAQDQCHSAGVCDTTTGACSNPIKTNGSSCSDGNACTQTDTCQAGTCTGSNPVTCTAQDQCHDAGVCNTATGVCSNPNKTNGTSCSDGNSCTQTDTCQAGTCTGSNPVTCTALDQCHSAGVCNTATGVCSNPNKTNGTSCSDGNSCTQTDTCQAGTCTGSNPVTCTALDQCHDAGVCNTATGVCSNPSKANGTSCSDGNSCTQTDTCQAGMCTGSNPVTCTAQDQCHDAGSCDPTTGACSNPNKTNGMSCSDGNSCTQTDTCQAGACTGGNPVTCAAQDQCHDAGSCDPTTGACSNPNKIDGAACNDGDACTQQDACTAGTCAGHDSVVCAAVDQCHAAGVCDPTSGACSSPKLPDGTACDDGDACTAADACASGACQPGNAVNCAAPDECHEAGVCQSLDGSCKYASKPDGTVCSLGECQDGVCAIVNGTGGAAGAGNGTGGTDAGGTSVGGAEVGGTAGSVNGGTATGGSAAGGSPTGGAQASGGSAGSATSDGGEPSEPTGEGGRVEQPDPGVGGTSQEPTGEASRQDSGCGCAVPGGRTNSGAAGLLLLGLVVAAGRRRRAA